jgi:hypothetical protein
MHEQTLDLELVDALGLEEALLGSVGGGRLCCAGSNLGREGGDAREGGPDMSFGGLG